MSSSDAVDAAGCLSRSADGDTMAICPRSQGVEPTAYGRALLRRGLAAFDELRQGVKDIEFLADPATGRCGWQAPPRSPEASSAVSSIGCHGDIHASCFIRRSQTPRSPDSTCPNASRDFAIRVDTRACIVGVPCQLQSVQAARLRAESPSGFVGMSAISARAQLKKGPLEVVMSAQKEPAGIAIAVAAKL